MSGVEVRIVTVQNTDDALGTENPATENAGAIELWRGGKRVVEFVWWEQKAVDLETLTQKPELYTAATVDSDVQHRVTVLQPQVMKGAYGK
jgi:hypothetical protein